MKMADLNVLLCAFVCAGSLSQEQRLEAMSKLKQYQCRVLISTDLVRSDIVCASDLVCAYKHACSAANK